MLLALLVSLVVAGAEPETAPAPEQTPAPSTAVEPVGGATVKPKRPGGDRLVCKRDSIPNSRFTTKVCKTVDEWEERAEAAREGFAETQQRPMVNIGKGN